MKFTLLALLMLSVPAFSESPDPDVRKVLNIFKNVPREMSQYVDDMKVRVAGAAIDAPAFTTGRIQQDDAEVALDSIAGGISQLTWGIAPMEELPEDALVKARQYKDRPVIYCNSDGVYYVIAERASSIRTEREAMRAVFVEVFEQETGGLGVSRGHRRNFADSLCQSTENARAQRAQPPRYVPRQQPRRQQHYQQPTPAPAPVIVNVPAPIPTPPSPVYQAQTQTEVARLQAEVDRIRQESHARQEQERLRNELEKTQLQSQLSAARDTRRNLEADFQQWIGEHQKQDRELGKDFDFRREQRSGHYQPEYPAYLAPGGWGTTNPYGAGGATIYYCKVCGEWLDLPERFQSLKPR